METQGGMEKKPTITFLKVQVSHSAILASYLRVMREVLVLSLPVVLLSCLGILLGEEAFATIEYPGMTPEPPSGFTPIQNNSSRPPISLEKLAINAQFVPSESNFTGSYQMSVFELNLSPNSQLCPENNCQYGFEDGVLSPTASSYGLEGTLHISTQATEGITSKVYDIRGDLYRVETLQQSDKVTNLLTGELKVGNGSDSFGDTFDYRITNSSLVFTPAGADLILLGERNSTAGVQQQPSNMTALPSQQPSNMTALPSQQPSNMTLLRQPVIEQTPSSPLSQLQQLPTTSPSTGQTTIPQQQQFFPSSPLTSPTVPVQPQVSYYPPSSTAYPSTIYPPSGTTYPSTVYPPAGTFPSTGFPMAAAGGMGGVSTPSQIIAPWFPSLPATNCGGTFVMTVEGVPEGNNGNGNDRITPSGGGDNNGNSDNNDDNKQYSGKSNRRLAVQINSDNNQIITGQQQDPIFGQIFQGQRNIDQNNANDFDIRSIFNDCQVSTYSKLG
jgi:hypothetical protein